MSNFAEMLDQLIDAVKEYCKYPDLYMRRNYQDARNGILKSINKLLADVQKVNEISSDYEDRLSELRDVIFELDKEVYRLRKGE